MHPRDVQVGWVKWKHFLREAGYTVSPVRSSRCEVWGAGREAKTEGWGDGKQGLEPGRDGSRKHPRCHGNRV